MKKVCGWTGKLLRVNLTEKKISIEGWDRGWIGGKAFGAWTMFEEEPLDCEDFDPGRVLIISCGPLTGTLAPSSSRGNVSNRNLTTGGISTSSIGGFFPAEMKFAGYDHLIIEGTAEKPVYLYINNDEARILDASHLWGKSTWETDSLLKGHYSDPNLRVACIGLAGENRVRSACVISERNRAASWGGNGAVLGAKNLKAIAVRGTKPVHIAHPEEFRSAVREAKERLDHAFGVKLLRRGGTLGVISSELNPFTFRNYQDDCWDSSTANGLTYKIFRKKHGGRPVGCFNCSIACGRFFTVGGGKYAGIQMEGVQINALRGLGSNLDISSTEEIIKANAIANEYGLGIDGISALVGWVLECFDKGLISEKDLGYAVKWGDVESFIRLTQDICHRRGLGDLLAEGINRASRIIGRGTVERAVLVKGGEVNEGRMRSHRAWALGIACSPRGGGHLDGSPAMEGVGLDEELCRGTYGISNVSAATDYENKARLVAFTERLKMLVDSLGLCYYTSIWNDPSSLGPRDYARLYSAATGDERAADELLEICEKAINVEKAFNTLHGNFTREDDYPPPRLMTEPVKSGPFRGQRIDKERWARMLDEYYDLHGWDRTTGLQLSSQLKRMDLESVADRLKEEGRIPA